MKPIMEPILSTPPFLRAIIPGRKRKRQIDDGANVEVDDVANSVELLVLKEAGSHDAGIVDQDIGVKAETA